MRRTAVKVEIVPDVTDALTTMGLDISAVLGTANTTITVPDDFRSVA